MNQQVTSDLTIKIIVGYYKSHTIEGKPITLITTQQLSSLNGGILKESTTTKECNGVSSYEAILTTIGDSLAHFPRFVDQIQDVMSNINSISISIISSERMMKKAIGRINDLVDFMSDEYDLTPQEQLDVYWKVEPRVPKTAEAMNQIALALYGAKHKVRLNLNANFEKGDMATLKELTSQCKSKMKTNLMSKQSKIVPLRKEMRNV